VRSEFRTHIVCADEEESGRQECEVIALHTVNKVGNIEASAIGGIEASWRGDTRMVLEVTKNDIAFPQLLNKSP